VLLGVTGSGKTFTMAKVIEQAQRPALILAPNKTLAAQLYGEFKAFFPENAGRVLRQLLRLLPARGLRPAHRPLCGEGQLDQRDDRAPPHSATRAILERDDVIVVASVSCIYGIGSVETYTAMTFAWRWASRWRRPSSAPTSSPCSTSATTRPSGAGTFRRRGDTVEIWPVHYEDRAWRVSFFGDEVESIASSIRSRARSWPTCPPSPSTPPATTSRPGPR
jgi:excinuclease ABC subunit B